MNKLTFIRKSIIGAICFIIIAAGSGIAQNQTTYAATTSKTVQQASLQKKTAIISYAKSLMGKVKYRFGSNNPSRLLLDCSSFTKYVFEKNGISLKWGSTAQSKQGKFVSKSSLQMGDLLFFSVGTPGKINHVGIYIGDGEFIHNTNSGSANGVIISDLSNYSLRYLTARRVG